MMSRRTSSRAAHVREVAEHRVARDFTRLPEATDPARLVETHDVTPEAPEPGTIWATPDLADMARTNALGAL